MLEKSLELLPSETEQVRELHRMLKLGTPSLVGPGPDGEERMELPHSIYDLLKNVVRNMMKGKIITLVPTSQRVTTQRAANILGCSRPHFIKLLEQGTIPFERIGQHRRILLKDLMNYQKNRDVERHQALNELAKQEFGEGSYEGIPIPEGGSDE